MSRPVAAFALGCEPLGDLPLIGANRNLHLLLTAGHVFTSLDDDTEFRFVARESSGADATAQTTHRMDEEPEETWFYGQRDALMANVHAANAPLPATGSSSSGPVPLLTSCGLAGDCGWGTPSRFLFVNDASFERLAANNETYRQWTASRHMLRQVRRETSSDQLDNFMSTAFMADNRQLLPPFLPLGRGSDVLFGRMLSRLHPGARFRHVPAAVVHSPDSQRTFWPGEILRSASSTDLKTFFCEALDLHVSGPTSYHAMGGHFVTLGTLGAAEFQNAVMELRRHAAGRTAIFLHERLDRTPSAAPACIADLREYRARVVATADRLASAIPAELQLNADTRAALDRLQWIVRSFGELLQHWPTIVATSPAWSPNLLSSLRSV